MTYAQALFCLLETQSLRPRSLGVLSSRGAKGAVVWGDNRAPWAQTEDVLGELMHPFGEGLGCKEKSEGSYFLSIYHVQHSVHTNDLWVYYNNLQITKVTVSIILWLFTPRTSHNNKYKVLIIILIIWEYRYLTDIQRWNADEIMSVVVSLSTLKQHWTRSVRWISIHQIFDRWEFHTFINTPQMSNIVEITFRTFSQLTNDKIIDSQSESTDLNELKHLKWQTTAVHAWYRTLSPVPLDCSWCGRAFTLLWTWRIPKVCWRDVCYFSIDYTYNFHFVYDNN